MSYIKTKKGIYRVVDENEAFIVGAVQGMFAVYHNRDGEQAIPFDSVVDRSDNIEELCDEFVRVCERFNICEFLSKKEKKDLLEKRLKTNAITCFYGAIWTNKGLIYVAKMNNKGELELL